MESTHPPTHSWFHETILECLLCARPWAHTHPWAAPGCTWEVSNVHIPQHRLRHCSAESWTLAPEILTNLGRDVGIYIFTSSPGNSAEDGPWVILHCVPWGRDDQGAVPHPSQGQGPCQRTAESCALKGIRVLCPHSPLAPSLPRPLHAFHSRKRVTCCLSLCIQTQKNCLLLHLQVCPYFFLVWTTFQ